MKKLELFLWISALCGMAFKFTAIPGGSVIWVLSVSALASLYFWLSFALLNGIGFRSIFSKGAFKSIPASQIAGALALGLAFAVVLIGVLFRLQGWPGSMPILYAGTAGVLIGSLLLLASKKKTRSVFYRQATKRTLIFAVIALLMALTPAEIIDEFRALSSPGPVAPGQIDN